MNRGHVITNSRLIYVYVRNGKILLRGNAADSPFNYRLSSPKSFCHGKNNTVICLSIVFAEVHEIMLRGWIKHLIDISKLIKTQNIIGSHRVVKYVQKVPKCD
jgi:hypothetical protein